MKNGSIVSSSIVDPGLRESSQVGEARPEWVRPAPVAPITLVQLFKVIRVLGERAPLSKTRTVFYSHLSREDGYSVIDHLVERGLVEVKELARTRFLSLTVEGKRALSLYLRLEAML